METISSPKLNSRIGFHYFPDTVHYRESDLNRWLPELTRLGANWLILTASLNRAIPERFLRGLLEAGIEPVLHFPFSLATPPGVEDLKILLDTYAKWGVRYTILFDRPNARSAWSVSTWTQEDLVERFMDRFLPVAESALAAGLIPIFPPLEQGGNYWDTSFLRASLQSIKRRGQVEMLGKLVLSAYGWSGEHSLNWGAGGPERWPGARPYFTPAMEEDQRGFRIFDWYLAIARSVIGRSMPIILLGAASPWDPRMASPSAEIPANYPHDCLMIAQLMAGLPISEKDQEETPLEPVPSEVLCANFWLLSANQDVPGSAAAWFQPDGTQLPVVKEMQAFASGRTQQLHKRFPSNQVGETEKFPIHHYLLLPMYEWGVADWHLEIIRPFVKKYQPTVGFSSKEAEMAERVTVIGGTEQFPDDILSHMRSHGCFVERIEGDGISIATLLAER